MRKKTSKDAQKARFHRPYLCICGTPQLPSTSFLQSPLKNPRKELKREDLVKRTCLLFFFEPIYLQKHRPFQAPELWK